MSLIPMLALFMAQSGPPPLGSAGVVPAALGPAVGERVPGFEALDQEGHTRDFASLAGPNGLVLVFFRSADW